MFVGTALSGFSDFVYYARDVQRTLVYADGAAVLTGIGRLRNMVARIARRLHRR